MPRKKDYTYKKGYLKVSDGHRLYYELWGNPKGKTVFYVHGGPGGGFSDSNKRFFDPKVWNVIFLDQRGAGRSKPYGSVKGNTTRKLVLDMKKMLDYLGHEKVYLFGGSWGATLALAFGVAYPEKVLGMVLWGIFLGSKKEVDYYIKGGVKQFYPEAWERFVRHVPVSERKDLVSYYMRKMRSRDKKVAGKYAYEWAYYEMSISRQVLKEDEIKRILKEDLSYKSLAILEAHYMKGYCFMEEGYLMRNVKKLRGVPVSIVQGRADFICPPETAYKLHKKLMGSQLFMVKGGHSSRVPAINRRLISEMKRFGRMK